MKRKSKESSDRLTSSLWNLRAVGLPIAAAIMLSGCSGCSWFGQKPEDPELGRQRSEIARLNKKVADLNEEVRRLKTKEGYLWISTAMAATSAGVLLCVGLAFGMKIRKSVLKSHEGEAKKH